MTWLHNGIPETMSIHKGRWYLQTFPYIIEHIIIAINIKNIKAERLHYNISVVRQLKSFNGIFQCNRFSGHCMLVWESLWLIRNLCYKKPGLAFKLYFVIYNLIMSLYFSVWYQMCPMLLVVFTDNYLSCANIFQPQILLNCIQTSR